LEKRIAEYVKRDLKSNENCKKLYSLISGQCTDFMQAKLELLNEYKSIRQGFDAITLIKAIKSLTYQFKDRNDHPQALHQAKRRLYLFHQGKKMMNTKFLEAFQTLVSVIKECEGEIGHDPGSITTALQGK
jgi:hypothetical protein